MNKTMYDDIKVSDDSKVKGGMLLLNHFKGLFMKRMISTLRMWKTYVGLAALSVLAIVALGYVANNPSRAQPPKATPLVMSSFGGYDNGNVFAYDTDNDLEYLEESITDHLRTESTTVLKKPNITDYLAEQANYDIINYAKTYIVGISKSQLPQYSFCQENQTKDVVIMRYNPIPYHSRPLATNLLSNFLLRLKGSSDEKIKMTSVPMVFKTDLTNEGITEPDFSISSMQYMTIMSIVMSLLLGLFIIFPLKERVTNAKQVQLMAGVNPFVFWITNFVWDFLIYIVIATVYLIIIYMFDTRLVFHVNGGFGALVILIVILGFAGIPWAYIMNFAFNSAPSAYAIMIISAIVLGICGPLAVIFLQLFPPDPECTDCADLPMISDIVRYIIMWIGPFFTFGHTIFAIVDTQVGFLFF